jgi:patatin-like phospholipase/acyl hydrolase
MPNARFIRLRLWNFIRYVDNVSSYGSISAHISTGGLITIGLFLMNWSADECLSRFEDIAAKTFMIEQKQEKLGLSQRIQRLLGAYVRDYRYDSSTIDKAFRSSLGVSSQMFNPLRSDTKVAVTATTARGNFPCVFSNYNGNSRLDGNSKSNLFFTWIFAEVRSILSYPC